MSFFFFGGGGMVKRFGIGKQGLNLRFSFLRRFCGEIKVGWRAAFLILLNVLSSNGVFVHRDF